jgi:hypothetical protein
MTTTPITITNRIKIDSYRLRHELGGMLTAIGHQVVAAQRLLEGIDEHATATYNMTDDDDLRGLALQATRVLEAVGGASDALKTLRATTRDAHRALLADVADVGHLEMARISEEAAS